MRHLPERFKATCSLCGDDLDIREPGVYQLTVGWVKNRTQGGGNAVALAERQKQWSCKACIERRINGQPQASLF